MGHFLCRIVLVSAAVYLCGCVAARRTGQLIGIGLGKTARAVPCILAEGLLDGAVDSAFEDDEDTPYERQAGRDRRERQKEVDAQWKQFWITNPDVNPKMTEAFSKERK